MQWNDINLETTILRTRSDRDNDDARREPKKEKKRDNIDIDTLSYASLPLEILSYVATY